MNSTIEAILENPVLEGLVRATLILALACIADGVLHSKNPRWRVLLSRTTVLLVFALPCIALFAPTWELAVLPHADVRVTSPLNEDVNAATSESILPVATGTLENFAASIPDVHSSPSETLPLSQVLLALCASVAIALLLGSILRYVLAIRRARHGTPAPPSMSILSGRIARDLGFSFEPEVFLDASARAPYVIGCVRPVMVLPERMASDAYAADLPSILSHELVHIQQRDTLWIPLIHLFKQALWFHPLAWRLQHAHAEACEAICDVQAAKYVGGIEKYGSCLARVALEVAGARRREAMAVPMVRRSQISRRLRDLDRGLGAAPLRRRPVWTATLVALAVATLLANVNLVRAQDPSTASDTAQPELADITTLFVWMPLTEPGGGIVGRAAILLTQATPDAADEAGNSNESTVGHVEKILESPLGLEFQDAHVSVILDFVSKTFDLKIVMENGVVAPRDWEGVLGEGNSYVTDGQVAYINLKNVSVNDALTAVLRPLGLGHSIESTFIRIRPLERPGPATELAISEVFSTESVEGEASGFGFPADASVRIRELLTYPVGFVFKDTHIRDILEFISETYDLNIIVDNRVVAPLGWQESEEEEDSYVTDGMIQYTKVMNLSMAQALTSLLSRLGLTYSVQRSFIWISSPEHILHETFEELETRFYELSKEELLTLFPATREEARRSRELEESFFIEPHQMLDQLQQLMPEIREPVTGRALSFLRYNGLMGVLVIHHTPSAHQKFTELLTSLFSVPLASGTVSKEIVRAQDPSNEADPGPDEPFEIITALTLDPSTESDQEQVGLLNKATVLTQDPSTEPGGEVVGRAAILLTQATPDAADPTPDSNQAARNPMKQILMTPVEFVYEDIRLNNLLAYVEDMYGLRYAVDKRVVAPAGWEGVPGKGNTYTTDGKIPYIKLKNVRLQEALEAMLRPLGLTYSLESSFIWISSRENFGEIDTRSYTVQGLELGDDLDGLFETLMVIIQDGDTSTYVIRSNDETYVFPDIGTRPASWQALDSTTRRLIIHHSPSAFAEFEALIRKEGWSIERITE